MQKQGFLFLLLAALLWAGVPVDGKPKDADDRLIDRVITAIHQHRMTSLRDDELMFACHDSNDGKFREVDVREEHRGNPKADPNTAPRLFTVRAEKRTGALSTDAARIDGKVFPYDGDYRPLSRKSEVRSQSRGGDPKLCLFTQGSEGAWSGEIHRAEWAAMIGRMKDEG